MRKKIVRYCEGEIDVKAIVEANPDIWDRSAPDLVAALMKIFDAHMSGEIGCGGRGHFALQWAIHDLRLIARAIFRDEFDEADRLDGLMRQHAAEWNARQKKPIPRRLRTAVFERDGYRCKHCGGFSGLAADHVVPESKGGPTTLDNLQTLCRPCNQRKGSRDEGGP